jgi:molybdate transport system ATP-binding protein
MTAAILVQFDGATVRRVPGGDVVFPSLNWTIRHGEAWAITGPIGSGKSTLAETVSGRHRVSAGQASWPIGPANSLPSHVIARVGFREESQAFSYGGKYYQQRYEFVAGDDDVVVTLRRYLGDSGSFGIVDTSGQTLRDAVQWSDAESPNR